MNMFDAVNNVGRVMKFFGSEIEKSKRYRQRPAVQVTPPAIPPAEGFIEITVCTDGLRRRVHATRIQGCTVYWE